MTDALGALLWLARDGQVIPLTVVEYCALSGDQVRNTRVFFQREAAEVFASGGTAHTDANHCGGCGHTLDLLGDPICPNPKCRRDTRKSTVMFAGRSLMSVAKHESEAEVSRLLDEWEQLIQQRLTRTSNYAPHIARMTRDDQMTEVLPPEQRSKEGSK